MAPGAAARPVMDIAGIDIAHAVGAGDITGMRQGRGRRRGLVAHLPVGMECGEMQRHIGAKGIRQPAAQRIDLAIRIVLAGDQQCGDLKPDTGISLEVDQRIQHALVGIDIVFAEPDRLSPTEIARELPDLPRALADALAQLPPSDRDLAEAIGAVPTVLALAPSREANARLSGPLRLAPIRQAGGDPMPFLKTYRSLVQSQPDLRDAAVAAGAIAAEPDTDGVVRRLALAVAYQQTMVPSFALEVVRVGGAERSIMINTGALGIESIRIGDTIIPTDRRGRAVVHFAPPLARYISAADVLDPAFDPSELQGQVILLGV